MNAAVCILMYIYAPRPSYVYLHYAQLHLFWPIVKKKKKKKNSKLFQSSGVTLGPHESSLRLSLVRFRPSLGVEPF